jgi:hypothetical protein
MPTDAFSTADVMRAVGRVVLAAIAEAESDADPRVFVAGLEGPDPDNAELVPVADDFSEAGTPFVTMALGPWSPALFGSSERRTLQVKGAVWRDRTPIGDVVKLLLADLDAIVDLVIEHSKAFLEVDYVQSVKCKGGPGIRARAVPRGTNADRIFLTVPFDLEIKCERRASPQPA